MEPSRTLFPEIEPDERRMIAVGDGHVLHVEQVGRPDAMPALFLHGGPGSGCQPMQRRLFDPARFRAILLDQRGAGRSTPKGSLAANTTAHLVADLERVRTALGIERWMVVGGSWGALLGVAYAQAHPERVTALVLRAVFLGADEEVRWAFLDGPRVFYPELYRAFLELLPPDERADPLAAYGARLEHPDPSVRLAAACVWHDYEQALSQLAPPSLALPPKLDAAAVAGRAMPSTPAVEWHYFKQRCFLAPGQLLAQAPRLAGVPGRIVQGRYDLLCPPRTAHALAAAWKGAELRVVPAAGHALAESAILEGVVAAIDELGRRLA